MTTLPSEENTYTTASAQRHSETLDQAGSQELSQPFPTRPPGASDRDEREEVSAFVGRGTTFVGTLSFVDHVRVDGSVEGEILGGRLVVVGPSARVKGVIRAQFVVILGASVEARVEATGGIELRCGAVVKGDLSAPHVHMDPDIDFAGRCDMHPGRRAESPTPPPEPGTREPPC